MAAINPTVNVVTVELSKRELFAAMIMQALAVNKSCNGLDNNYHYSDKYRRDMNHDSSEDIACTAVNCANALIRELRDREDVDNG